MRRIDIRPGVMALLLLSALALIWNGSALASNSVQRVPAAQKWLTFDASSHLATLTLVPNYNYVNWGYNFDGYAHGRMTVTIPVGWRVKVVCSVSPLATVTHSCAITTAIGSDETAFPRSKIPNAMNGLPPGDSAVFSFTASRPGTYAIQCLVPGHDDATMWDVFSVTSAALPSISLK